MRLTLPSLEKAQPSPTAHLPKVNKEIIEKRKMKNELLKQEDYA